jgi:hypothetical protein
MRYNRGGVEPPDVSVSDTAFMVEHGLMRKNGVAAQVIPGSSAVRPVNNTPYQKMNLSRQ